MVQHVTSQVKAGARPLSLGFGAVPGVELEETAPPLGVGVARCNVVAPRPPNGKKQPVNPTDPR